MNIQLDKQALMPVRAHDTDAGLDLLSPVDTVIPAHGAVTIDTGVHIELPPNTAGFLKSKSGLNMKYGITSWWWSRSTLRSWYWWTSWQTPNAEMAGSGEQGGEQDVYSSTNYSCGRGGHCCIFRRDRLWSEL